MKQLKLFLCLLIFLINCLSKGETAKCSCNPTTITLPQGKIRGSYDVQKTQIKFLGIPYATVEEKFQAPGKPPSLNGTFNADRGSILCKQYNEQWQTVVGQEDCLVLNVFTPTRRDKKPFPVMVFIHGGGFYIGSNAEEIYNPKYFVKEKVIVVTINYRLGALGFLCLHLPEAPGNAGLKDQIAALKWIQNNIARFGGDPDKVTLFGQGSGGASTNYLMLFHSAKGLFQRAIIESGTILSPHGVRYNPIEIASNVVLGMGYNTSNPEELLKIYTNLPTDDIITASAGNTSSNPFSPYVFGPCVETAITRGRPLITESPRELLRNKALDIPVIIGFNNKEGIKWASPYVPISLDKIKDNFDDIIPSYLFFENEADKKAFIDDIISVYFSNGSVTDNLIDYFTDSIIRYPVISVTERLLKKTEMNIYNYYFTYDSIRNVNKLTSKLSNVTGAAHGDELFYLFDPVLLDLPSPNSKDRTMIKNMVKLWTSFAKNGKPSAPEIAWRPSGKQLHFIELGAEIKMTTLPSKDRMKFWREIYSKYGR